MNQFSDQSIFTMYVIYNFEMIKYAKEYVFP